MMNQHRQSNANPKTNPIIFPPYAKHSMVGLKNNYASISTANGKRSPDQSI